MDLDFGPLGVLICWQSVLLALCVATATHGVKATFDFFIKGGREERKKKLFVNRIVLPATPIIIGAMIAVFVPLHPDALLQYVTDHSLEGGKKLAIFLAYGACLGQFSDYVWHRFSGLKEDVKKKKDKADLGQAVTDAANAAPPGEAAVVVVPREPPPPAS